MKRLPPTNSFALLAVLLLLIVTIGAAPATQPSTRVLFAAASQSDDWIVRLSADKSDKDAPPHWAVLNRQAAAPHAGWAEVAALGQRPVAIAPYGERLAVLFDDSTWSLISIGDQVAGPAVPDDLVLMSMIEEGNQLVFLARNSFDASSLSLIDFDGQSLSAPRPVLSVGGKADYDPRFVNVTDNAQFTIAGAAPDSGPKIAMAADGRLRAFAFKNGVYLGSPGGKGIDVPVTLPAAAIDQPLTLTHEADGSARFWWIEGDDVVSRGFHLNGTAIDEPATIAMRAVPTPPLFERGLMVVGVLTLVLVLFAGGRQAVASGRPLVAKAPPRPAPLARRLAAGIIDLIPLAGCVVYLAMRDKLTIYAGMLRFDSGMSELILTAGVLFYLVLLFAFELQWQRSIGKAIFALRVVAIDGGKPQPVALLLRNALRLVDFNLITLLFVPVTPLKQRLGDFLAGTMVVDAMDVEATEPASVTPDRERDNK